MTAFSPLPLIVVGLHETGGYQEDTISGDGAGRDIGSGNDDGDGGGARGVWVGGSKDDGSGVASEGDADGEFANKHCSSARNNFKKPGNGHCLNVIIGIHFVIFTGLAKKSEL